jgi:hypothetical protein
MMRSFLGVAFVLGVTCVLPPGVSADPLPAYAHSSAFTVIAANDARRKSARVRDRSKPDRDTRPAEPIPPLPERKSAQGSPPAEVVPDVWSQQEIETAKARCASVLKRIDAVVEPQPPIKEGKCGTPAPVRLVSLGKKPQVSFSPPALVNCDMVAALDTWLNTELQPLAVKHLGAKIAKVEVMSDYSCRAAFGRAGNRLSQHAFVDALDIRGFVMDDGKAARIIEAWGMTRRDLAAQAEAAKAQAADASQRAAADTAAQHNLKDGKSPPAAGPHPQAVVASNLGTPGAGLARRTGANRITVTLPGASSKDAFKPAGPARLGGPGPRAKSDDASRDKSADPGRLAALSPHKNLLLPAPEPQSRFLRAAHAAACRIFGTTIGPESNEAHRNHFHVDMAERKITKICD